MEAISELPLIGGHPALDFVNTAEERGHPEAGDALCTVGDLIVWGRRYGLLANNASADAAELTRAVEARELLYRLFFAQARGLPYPRADLKRLAGLVAEAYGAAKLEPLASNGTSWRWPQSRLSSVRHVAVTSALDLLQSDARSRVKQCPGEQCGWFFLDSTKRGNRRWCSMTECGQDAKSARRRVRSRSAK